MNDKAKLSLVQEKSDPFSIENLRLKQNFDELIGVKKQITLIPVRRPHRQEFIRVSSDPQMRLETVVYEEKEEKETYLVNPCLWSELGQELVPKVFYCYMNTKGVLRLWPVRVPGEDGKLDTWSLSAHKAAELAKEYWVRVAPNKSLGAYEVFHPLGDLDEPDWPKLTMQQIVDVAFEHRRIDSMDHPLVRGLGLSDALRVGDL